MHPTTIYLMSHALLTVIAYVQVQVQASPVSIQAVMQELRACKVTDPQAEPDATLVAMEPIKRSVFERAEETTTMSLAKLATEEETVTTTTTERRGLEEDDATGTLPEPCLKEYLDVVQPACVCQKQQWSVYDFPH